MAANYLMSLGFEILYRNYHSTYGELDIIAREREEIVVVEVKTRTGGLHGKAESSISISKRKKITASFMQFVSQHPEYSQLSCRIDAIIVNYCKKDETYKIAHYPNAFEPIMPAWQ